MSHKKFCVYRIRHIETDATIYIGKTARPRKRWANHCNAKRCNHLRQYMLQNGGFQAYELQPLQWWDNEEAAYTDERLRIAEAMKTCPLLQNRQTGGFGGSPNRMSAVHKARLQGLSAEERLTLTSKAHDAIRGVPRSSETKQAISDALKAWHQDHPERAAQVGYMRLGAIHTESTRKRMGQAKRALDTEQVAVCQRLRSEGWSLKRIAQALGLSVKPIFNALHGVGVYGEKKD